MNQLENQSPSFNIVHGNVPDVFSLDRVKISESIFSLLHPVMNEIHGVNFSLRFWKIVLNEYVNSAVSIKHILEQQEIDVAPVLLPINSHHELSFKQRIIARLPALIKHFKTPGTLEKINSLFSQNRQLSIGLPDIEVVRKETGSPLPLYYPVYPGKGNAAKRKKVDAIAGRYTNVYQRNIIKRLPQVFVEYFEKDFNRIKLAEPALKTFHVHGTPPLFSSLIIAKYAEHGAQFFSYQHGAYYGEIVGHNSYLHESDVSDRFHTWGWRLTANDVPWKAYRLEKFKQQYDAAPKTKAFDFLMCYPNLYDLNKDFYKEGTEYFLQHINTEKYKTLLARPRPMNRLFSQAKTISFIQDSRVTIDSGLGSMTEVIGKCKLVVQFTIPATNFMECLYVDHPTMGLLDNSQPTDIVKPYYEFFMQQGVMHKNFASLVQHLNNIDLEEWWATVTSKPMYQQFKNEFLKKV